jgi:hypothetical protein
MMLEEICIKEELNDRRILQLTLNKLKAGQDIENALIQNYMKNSDKY